MILISANFGLVLYLAVRNDHSLAGSNNTKSITFQF